MESDLWRTLRDRMKMHGHFERIENMVGSGMPDVTYCLRGVEGFIELKQSPSWPVRSDTPLSLPHYTPQQRIWALRRLNAGGRVYLLLQVVRPVIWYGLLPSFWTRKHLGIDATQMDIRAAAIVSGERVFPTNAMIYALRK